MNKFWMVWNTQGSRPREKHENLAAALDEAHRIAAKHPGAEVHVLETVGCYQMPVLAPVFTRIEEKPAAGINGECTPGINGVTFA